MPVIARVQNLRSAGTVLTDRMLQAPAALLLDPSAPILASRADFIRRTADLDHALNAARTKDEQGSLPGISDNARNTLIDTRMRAEADWLAEQIAQFGAERVQNAMNTIAHAKTLMAAPSFDAHRASSVELSAGLREAMAALPKPDLDTFFAAYARTENAARAYALAAHECLDADTAQCLQTLVALQAAFYTRGGQGDNLAQIGRLYMMDGVPLFADAAYTDLSESAAQILRAMENDIMRSDMRSSPPLETAL